MLPTDDFMTERCRRLGIDADSRIVVYDNSPTHSAARGWWMMRLYGVGKSAAILDGGLPKCLAEGRPTESGMPRPPPGNAGRTAPSRDRGRGGKEVSSRVKMG